MAVRARALEEPWSGDDDGSAASSRRPRTTTTPRLSPEEAHAEGRPQHHAALEVFFAHADASDLWASCAPSRRWRRAQLSRIGGRDVFVGLIGGFAFRQGSTSAACAEVVRLCETLFRRVGAAGVTVGRKRFACVLDADDHHRDDADDDDDDDSTCEGGQPHHAVCSVLYDRRERDSVRVPRGVTHWVVSRGGCTVVPTTRHAGPRTENATLETAWLPSARSIEPSALCQHPALTAVALPNVERVGFGAFAFCERLERVDLPRATIVGPCAFLHCDRLAHAAVPTAERLECRAFADCARLTATLPATARVSPSAFDGAAAVVRVRPSRGRDDGTRVFSVSASCAPVASPLSSASSKRPWPPAPPLLVCTIGVRGIPLVTTPR